MTHQKPVVVAVRDCLGHQGAVAQSRERSSLGTSPSLPFALLWEGKQHFLFMEVI